MRNRNRKALELLGSDHFFSDLRCALRKHGLVNEERSALVAYIVATSRLLKQPLSLFVKGPSSIGKNYLTDAVLGLFPPTAVQSLTSSSNRSMNYMGGKLAHKVLYLRERNDAAGPIHPGRLLISEKQLVHWVTVKRHGRFFQEKRVTKGPIASISTTTKNRVLVDDETRNISVWLDESPRQTTRIMEAAVDKQNGLKASERKAWHKVQQLIQERAAYSIELPDWFKDLTLYVRNDSLWARRYFPAFLQACKTVALIRSFRRKAPFKNKSKVILVRFTDFAVAASIFNPVFDQSIGKSDDQLLQVQEQIRRISARSRNGVSATDLAEALGISTDRAYGLLRRAVDAGSIVRSNQPSKTNLKLYLPAKARPFLPDPAEVFQKLEGLPVRVRFVHPISGEWVTYSRRRSGGRD